MLTRQDLKCQQCKTKEMIEHEEHKKLNCWQKLQNPK